jgi:hypothetical protein
LPNDLVEKQSRLPQIIIGRITVFSGVRNFPKDIFDSRDRLILGPAIEGSVDSMFDGRSNVSQVPRRAWQRRNCLGHPLWELFPVRL